MDNITDAMEMIDHLTQPAFCVREGTIVKVNPAGTARMIEPGCQISDLLNTGREEYSEFTDGCLYLTLSLNGQIRGASVTRKKDFDLFMLDHNDQANELQAMALAARELREPLASIMITANQLFPETDREKPETREYTAWINRGLFQMLRIISNMSDANRYVNDTQAPREIQDVSGIFRETIAKAAVLAEQAGIRLESDIYPEPIYALADAEKLERAIYNIISNALKFTPAGGLVKAALTRRGDKLYFCVQDNGSGIAENLRSGIFTRYTREPGLEDGRFGIGLGLLLIRSAAALHEGTVLVDHPQNAGTRTTMTMTIRSGDGKNVHSPRMRVDYAGEWDHCLLELSDCLPASLFDPLKDN